MTLRPAVRGVTVRARCQVTRSVAPLLCVLLVGACGSDPGRLPDGLDGTPSANPPADSSTHDPPSTAPPKRTQGVAFIHGTGDRGDVSDLVCSGIAEDWRCGSPNAVDYWTQETIDSERTRADGSLRPYVVVGCPLSAQTPWPNPTPVKPKNGPPEPGSAACVAAEIAKFVEGPDGAPGTEDDVDDLAIVTHSGGSNVIRYILQQHSSRDDFGRIHAAARGFVAIAAPSRGTYLADRVFGFGLLGVGNDLLGAGYDDDGVEFIQTTKMALFNQDPSKLVDLSKDVAGVPVYVGSGSYPDKDGAEEQIACGGGSETRGLNLVHELYMDETDEATARDSCSDGFISCVSAMALANGDVSRVVFGQLGGQTIGKTRFRAHNQSRRSCDGVDRDIRAKVIAILDGDEAGSAPPSLRAAPSRRERFVPMARSVTTRSRSIQLEAPASARAGELLRVRVDARGERLEGFMEDPTGTSKIPATFERDPAGVVFAQVRLPADARAGAWTAHIAEQGDLERHLDARVPLWVSASLGAIVDARAIADDRGVLLRITAATYGGRRIGARATLVSETAEDAWVVTTSQVTTDADPRGATVLDLVFRSPQGPLHEGRLVVRDVALVSHDDATTLDVRERIELTP